MTTIATIQFQISDLDHMVVVLPIEGEPYVRTCAQEGVSWIQPCVKAIVGEKTCPELVYYEYNGSGHSMQFHSMHTSRLPQIVEKPSGGDDVPPLNVRAWQIIQKYGGWAGDYYGYAMRGPCVLTRISLSEVNQILSTLDPSVVPTTAAVSKLPPSAYKAPVSDYEISPTASGWPEKYRGRNFVKEAITNQAKEQKKE